LKSQFQILTLKTTKKMNLQHTQKTVKYLTFKEILKDKKCTYTNLQKHVLKVSKKDPIKEYTRGYYCTNICNWKNDKLIIKKGKFYRLTSLGKLYLKDPQKANDKIKINNLKLKVNRYIDLSNHWYNESKNNSKINNDSDFKIKGSNYFTTDFIDITHPDKDNDIYLKFYDNKTNLEHQIYITIDGFIDSFKKSYLDKLLNDYTNELKFRLNNL
jgi:hypothetical protein